MRQEVVNRYYGTKIIHPTKASAEKFISTCKKDPQDHQPVWALGKELPDAAPEGKQSKEELLALLAEYEEPLAEPEDDELEKARRAYLLAFGKEAHPNATVNSIDKKLKGLES